MYDEEAKIWHMMWVSTNGKQAQDLRAEVRDGKLIRWQVYPERPNWQAEFIRLDHCRWAREDGTTTEAASGNAEDSAWQPGFRLVATKRDCKP